MRKLLVTLLLMFVLYVIYYDLSQGVLSTPTSLVLIKNEENQQQINEMTNKQVEEEEKENAHDVTDDNPINKELYYQEVQVTAGQTVLSIVEQIHNGPLPVSISQLITDFQLLNPKTEPERIQIGKVYKFPVYDEQD